MKIPQAGEELDAYCTRCKLDLNHRVVAMVGDITKRVNCLTCHSEHNFRKPKGASVATTKKKTKKKTVRETAADKLRAEWASETEGHPDDAFAGYSMDSVLSEGDLILHKKFGKGHVQEVTAEGKVQVLFEEGVKRLAQGT